MLRRYVEGVMISGSFELVLGERSNCLNEASEELGARIDSDTETIWLCGYTHPHTGVVVWNTLVAKKTSRKF